MDTVLARGLSHDQHVARIRVDNPGPDNVAAALMRFQAETGAQPLRVLSAGALPHESVTTTLPFVAIGPDRGPAATSAVLEIRGVAGESAKVATPLPGVAVVQIERPDGSAATSVTASACGSPTLDFEAQARQVFDEIGQAVDAGGLRPEDITRTWFYISSILDNYTAFNRVRDDYFERWGITRFPASTGIGAALPHMQLIAAAIDAVAGVEVLEVATNRQSAPVSYGPRFVRANTYDDDGLRTLNISGVSSIDDHGRSLATGGVDEIVHCLDSFVDLLDGADMTAADLQSFYLYCTSPELAAQVVVCAASRGLPEPTLINFADVCRPDLRVEIEGRAVRRCG